MHANAFAFNIEIKPTPGLEQATGHAVGAACQALVAGIIAAPLIFSSFRPEALAGARETRTEVPRALLVDSLWAGWFDVARSLGCSAVVSNHKLMDAALLAQLHTAGLRGLCYTVNDAGRSAQRCIALGHRRPHHRRGGPLFAGCEGSLRSVDRRALLGILILLSKDL
jgi:glycerophosphoryl diester phosphodiesterase